MNTIIVASDALNSYRFVVSPQKAFVATIDPSKRRFSCSKMHVERIGTHVQARKTFVQTIVSTKEALSMKKAVRNYAFTSQLTGKCSAMF